MELNDFKNKKITVMGVGLHGGGVGVIKFLAAQEAQILATDKRKSSELTESLELLKDLPINFVLGEHRMEDFTDADMIIKNPAVPDDSEFLKAAREKKIPIESDIGIFFELCPAPIIGVTGTKGKSTSAALLAAILKTKFPQVILAGNIRSSVLTHLPEITKDSIVVLELSSWQLGDAKGHKISPQTALITNLLTDHMNRYKNFEEYVDDKKNIYLFQKPTDFLFLNYEDEFLKKLTAEAKSRVYFFSVDGNELLKTELMPKLSQEPRIGAYAKGKSIFFGSNHEKICQISDLKLSGEHNLKNALAAISIAKLYDVTNHDIKLALQKFNGLEGRLQKIAEINGVKFINDTAATAPDAAIASLEVLGTKQNEVKNIILISGGADKNLDFKKFGEVIAQKCKAAVLLPGSATQKIKKTVPGEFLIHKAPNMAKAVKIANELARPGDTVLLSPGCASFGLFRHEFERGKAFNEAVAALKNSKKA